MRFYRVKEEYYELLHTYDKTVLSNKNEKRPYVGIVLKINNFNYYIPLSSPKPKHLTMKDGKDFIKLKGGELGAININCMIPVDQKNLIEFDVNSEDEKYASLLRDQLHYIKKSADKIINNVQYMYSIQNMKSEELNSYQLKLIKRSCNYKLLEKVCYDQSYEYQAKKDLLKHGFKNTDNLVNNIVNLSLKYKEYQSIDSIKNKLKDFNQIADAQSQIYVQDINKELQKQLAHKEIASTLER